MKSRFRKRNNDIMKIVNKKKFKGDWPFIEDEIKIKKKGLSYIVIINDKEYALNGMAQMHLKLETPHEKGMAIIGKSIAPFIKMASRL
jgi:hypothetical protein